MKKAGSKSYFEFTSLQQRVIAQYAAGDMCHIGSKKELENCGDGLLTFLVREAGDAADQDEYQSMLDTAIRQIQELKNNLEQSSVPGVTA